MGDIRPIIILGAARSGTTLLAEHILAKHPKVVYWNEPSFIWNAGFSYRNDDLIGPDEVTDGYARFVTKTFGRRLRTAAPDSRFMEKTPSNCLRVEAILKVFPNAQFIHVIRDGRAVALSSSKEWRGAHSDSLDSSALRKKSGLPKIVELFRQESDLRLHFSSWRTAVELPAYFVRFVKAAYRQMVNPDNLLWGPRIPGLKQVRRSLSLLETCAIQWESCVRAAMSSGRSLSSSQYMEISYESLLKDPKNEIERILGFLALEPYENSQMNRFVDTIKDRSDLWRKRYAAEELQIVESRVGLTLEELGYLPGRFPEATNFRCAAE